MVLWKLVRRRQARLQSFPWQREKRYPMFEWAHKILSCQRGGQSEMHQVKSTFRWVSVHHIFEMLVSVHLLSTFRLSSFHVLSGTASFPVGLVNVVCKIVYLHSELLWEDHFPLLLLSACHTGICWLLFLSHQTSVTCLHRPFLSCMHFICHLSFSIDWLTPACSQLPTPTFSTHFLNFQTPLSFSHATAQAWEEPAVNTLKAISSLLCFKPQPVMPAGIFTMVREQMYCNHCLSWQSSLFSCILLLALPLEESSVCISFISETFCFVCILQLCELLWQGL